MNSHSKSSPLIEEPEAIWNPYATVNWSVLFTPAFGSWLQMKNWLSLGESELAAISKKWFYGSLITIFASTAISAYYPNPESIVGSGGYLLGAYLIIWYVTSARSQAKYVKEKFGDDYNRLPWRKPVLTAFGLGLLYLVLNLVFQIILTPAGAA